MEYLEKRLYEIDYINNSNYKDINNKNLKTPKLIKQYNLCDIEYINYIKSYFNKTENKPKYIHNKLTIIDITSGTGLLALSFLNAIYEENKEYILILNDILFKKINDTNINYIKSNIDLINKMYKNITIEIRTLDIKNDSLDEFIFLDNFVLISDPTISTKNSDSFETIDDFFNNDNINKLFYKASYILFKDSVQLGKKYKKMFEHKKYDKLEEGLDLEIISKNDLDLLSIFNKNINQDIKHLVNYSIKKLASIYFFNNKSKLLMGEENNYYYNGYSLDYSSIEYQNIEEENNKMKNILKLISQQEIINKYEELKDIL